MKIIFDNADIERIVADHAAKLIGAFRSNIKAEFAGYSYDRRIEVTFDEPLPEPVVSLVSEAA